MITLLSVAKNHREKFRIRGFSSSPCGFCILTNRMSFKKCLVYGSELRFPAKLPYGLYRDLRK